MLTLNWILFFESAAKSHEIIIEKFKLLSKNGTKITYLPGNHDSNYRTEDVFYDFPIKDEVTYKTKNNKKYLIFHGDQLDTSMYGKSKYLSKLGGLLFVTYLSSGITFLYSKGNKSIINSNLSISPYFSFIGNLGSS